MTRLALAGILVLAAGLRFAGIGWGLRHEPHSDERVFVENAAAMMAAGDLDHRYYEYPGLFFYLLGPVLWIVGAVPEPGFRGYLAGRSLVDVFGVVDVGLAYLLGRKIGGSRLGLLAALFLAVSPLDVFTAQTTRPDVVVQTFASLALIATLDVGAGVANDVRCGLAIGAATAVKFSGLLALAPYLARRVSTAGPKIKGLVLAVLCVAAVVGLSTAASLHRAAAVRAGVNDQWGYHFAAGAGRHVAAITAFFLRILWSDFGPLLCLLIAVGAVVGLLRDRGRVLPLVAFVIVTFAVHSLAHARFMRFLVPVSAALCVLGAIGVTAVGERLRIAPAAIGVVAAAVPLYHSASDARRVSAPHPWDAILDTLEARVPDGALVFVDAPRIGIDTQRYRVLSATGRTDLDRRALREADAAIVGTFTADLIKPDVVLAEAPQSLAGDVPWTRFQIVGRSVRPMYREVPVAATRVESSTERFVQFDLPTRRRVSRVRVNGPPVSGRARRLSLAYSPDAEGDTWLNVPRVLVPLARPGSPRTVGQVALIFEPVTARRLRLRFALGSKRAQPEVWVDEEVE